MKRDERDKEFYHWVQSLDTITGDMIEGYWCGRDSIQKEALATAIANGKIGFQIRPPHKDVPPDTLVFKDDYPSNNIRVYEGQDHKRVELVKEYILTSPHGWNKAVLNAKDLLEWLNKVYPLESTPESMPGLPFMSDQLAFAVECSKALYPDGYKRTSESTKVQVDRESSRIKDYLQKQDLSARAKEALIVQLNPVKK